LIRAQQGLLAIELLEALEHSSGPLDVRDLELLATVNRHAGRFDAALARASQVEARAPSSEAAYYEQAMTLAAQGDEVAALAATDRGLLQVPQSIRLLERRVELLRELGRLSEARETAQRMLTMTRAGAARAKGQWLLGTVLIAEGRRPEALRALAAAYQLEPHEARYAHALASLRWEIGDRNGAQAVLERSKAMGVTSPALERLRQQATASP
jgi:tetratricopeptide (TPR) repeat protein